jgi:2-dehydro-3-deoxyphosphogluconate aldolase / (4S)-4-hydroxy-2-oxoglutarate aldolase
MRTLAEILGHRIIPVLVIRDASRALDVGKALVAAGLPAVEVTLRTPDSWNALERLSSIDSLITGVGSVVTVDDMRRAHALGAAFAVSPGLSLPLVQAAADVSLPYLPGVATPSEVMAALQVGMTTLKWFPAETLGGAAALTAISAPFPSASFVPTGGINAGNAASYLCHPRVAAIGGSWMVPDALVSAGDVDGIRRLTVEALSLVKGIPS